MEYETRVTIWDFNNRVLLDTTRHFASPEEALAVVGELKKTISSAYACHFDMPDHPNQNTRSQFCHYGR